jgi:hypothetical protein
VAALLRNHWPASAGTTGRFPPESVAGITGIGIELTLGKFVRRTLNNLSVAVNQELKEDCISKAGDKNLYEVDAAGAILRELWKRMKKTHKLRLVK